MLLPVLLACGTTPPGETGADTALPDTGAADTGDSGDSGGDSTPDLPPFPTLHLGVPAFTAADDAGWAARTDGASRTGGWIVVDVAAGPGSGKDTAWGSTIAAARAAGVPVVGYVETGVNGDRASDDVSRDIGRWVAWYDIDGVFLDARAATDCDTVAAALAGAVAEADTKVADDDAFVVLAPPGEGCLAASTLADVVVTVGTPAALAAAAAPAWRTTEPADHFAFWATGAAEADLPTVMQLATDRAVGTVYLTDQADETPFDTLPAWWAAEVAAIVR
jgi:hypothetical protein